MRHLLALALIVGVLGSAGPAAAKHFRYRSPHPFHNGFCYLEGRHEHPDGPTDARVYRVIRGEYYFVGDPIAFGYHGPQYAYYDPHPVFDKANAFGEPVYCYLEGPHYHWYAPPSEARFESRAGVYWYVGAFEPVFYDRHPRYVTINEVYRPLSYGRPTVAVTDAPPGWRAPPRRVSPTRAVVVPAQPPAQFSVGIQLGPRPTPPVVVRERVIVSEPPGHARRHYDEDHDRGEGNGKWKGGKGHGRGHGNKD